MEHSEFDLIERVQDHHWWWIGRQRIIERLIRKYCPMDKTLQIADVGSGFGGNIAMLRAFGKVTALEPSTEAVAKINARWSAAGNVHAVAWSSPQPLKQKFDLILLADVLEHIADDAAAAAWIWEHLTPTGHAVLTVPAHRYLWTEMDEVVHHQRRYDYNSLRRLFSDKFEICRLSYYNLFLYPMKLLFVGFARLRRRLLPASRKRSFNDLPPGPVNGVFRFILSVEAFLIERFSLPFGVSMIIVARRAH